MAYGLKYYATAYGLASVEWKVQLLEKDYSGSTSELSMRNSGVKIGYDREEERFNPIYSRYAIIDLQVENDFNLDSLQFDDERKFQVKIYKNNVLEFIGWLIPFYSSELFEDESIASISVMAKDGINQLKNKTFVDAHPEIVSNKQSFKDIISQSLREIGYNLNLEIYYNKYEQNMNKTESDCPLAQLYVNVTSFDKEDGSMLDYFEVLRRLLITHDLQIKQTQGKWVIISSIEVVDGSISGRKFNYLGEYVSNVTLSTDVVIHTGGLKIKSNAQKRKSIPVQQFSALYDAGLLTNLLSNGKFNSFSGLNPINWTKVGFGLGEVSTILNSDGIQFDNTFTHSELAEDDKYFESEAIDISGLGSFEFTAEAYADDDIDSVKIAIIIYKEADSTAPIYYVDKYGSVKNYDVTAIIDKGTLNQKVEFNIKFEAGLPSNNTYYIGNSNRAKIRIYPGVKLTAELTPTNKTVQYRNLVFIGTAKNYDKDFVGRKYQLTNTALTTSKKEDEYTLYYQGQISGNVYDQSRFRNSLFVGDTATYANAWKRTPETTEYGIIESTLIDRLSVTSRFGDIFEGSIKGYIDSISTPKITADSKRFVVLWAEYDLQADSTEVVLTELFLIDVTFETKIFDKYSNGKLIDVSTGIASSKISVYERFNTTVINTGGVDSLPPVNDILLPPNKGHLGIGEEFAREIVIGNGNSLTKMLGLLQIGASPDNLFYDFSDIDGETGDFVNAKLGYNGDLFQIRNDLGVEGRLNVGVDFSIERVNPSGDIFQNLISSTEDIVFDSPKTIINNVLEANQIGGIGSAGVTAINNWTFNNPITIAPPIAPNHAVTQSFFYAALDAAMNGGNRLYGFVYAAATTNITLSGSQVVDGVTVPNGEKVLLPEQTDKTKNGIWIVNTSGAWTRATDFLDVDGYGNVQVSVITGVSNASAVFVCNIKTVITIDTTEITFTKIYQPFAQQYIAYRTAGNSPQQFYGTHVFEGKIKGQTPTESDDLTNKAYVDAQDTILSNTINNTINSLSTVYWGKISKEGIYTNGLGHVGNNPINFISNDIVVATLSQSGGLTGLSYLESKGMTIKGSPKVGYLSGSNSASSYNLDIIKDSGNTRAALRFSEWISLAGLPSPKRAIEFDINRNLIIGTYNSNSAVDEKTFDSSKSIIFKESGFSGFGIDPTERIHSVANIRWEGVLKPSGNAPTADEQFLVSNSTTGNKYINYNPFGKFQGHEDFSNVADAPFGASFVYGNGTDATGLPDDVAQGHVIKMGIGTGYPDQYTILALGRPFGTYYKGFYLKGVYGPDATTDWIQIGGDVRTYTEEIGEANEVLRGIYYEEIPDTKQAFIGVRGVTGDLILRLNVENEGDSTIKQYNNIMSTADGRLYYSDADSNEPVRYALITEVGNAGGVIYSFEEPLYVDASQKVRIKQANNSTTGVLTAADWTRFDAKIGDGGTINNELKFAFSKRLKFMKSDGSAPITQIYSTNTLGSDYLFMQTTGVMSIESTNSLYLTGGGTVSEMVFIDNVGFDLTDVESLEGGNAKFFISNLGGGKFKAKLVAA